MPASPPRRKAHVEALTLQAIEIFKTGRHTSMAGQTIAFSEGDLAACAAAYDPAVHEAPIVVGHPRADGPAYGWVGGLLATGGSLVASPHQVDTAFAELVQNGRFKKVSASFYAPDAPGNPKPGVYYLRHVGFLGAQPPAVKGLKPVAFAEGEAGIVEFSDAYATSIVARLLSGMRDFLIGQFGQDQADTVLPRADIDDLTTTAAFEMGREMARAAGDAPGGNDFSEPQNKEPPVAEKDPAAAAALAERERQIAAREAAFAEREAAERARDNEAFVGGLVDGGQLLPAQRGLALAFMARLDASEVLEFGEAGQATAAGAFRQLLGALPKVVPLGVTAGDASTPLANANDPADIVARSVEYQEAMARKGLVISNIDAIQAVTRGTKQ